MENMGKMKITDLTIITPCFNEEESITDCITSVRNMMIKNLHEISYEHIVIDNNSTDSTVKIISEICLYDKNVKLLVNSKNVGAFQSIYRAMGESSGLSLIPMYAADLQDPVEVIPEFFKLWKSGYKVVFGVRKNRIENFFMKHIRTIYYRIIQKFAEGNIPINAGEFMLIDIKIVESLLATKDHEPYIRGMVANTGVNSIQVEYLMNSRKKGKSKTNLFNLLDTALNAFVGTSRIPARIALIFGFLFSIGSVSLLFIQQLISQFTKYTQIDLISLNTSLIVFIGGTQIFFLGLIGEYVLSIHSQVRRYPEPFFIKKINFD